jgi:hypothetical protein
VSILSCSKSNEDTIPVNVPENTPNNQQKLDELFKDNHYESIDYGLNLFKRQTDDEKNFIYEITGRMHTKYYEDYFVVLLENGNLICKVNSVDKEYFKNTPNKQLRGFDPEVDYNIIFIDVKNGTHKIIITDKFNNLQLLPVVYNGTRQQRGGDDTIYTAWSRCFIFQKIQPTRFLEDNIYKLIYLDDFNYKMIQKEYEYKSTYYPDIISITVTPNYFIVHHDEIDGEEYILINRETGEYKTLDSEKFEGHK